MPPARRTLILASSTWPALVALGGCFSMSPTPPDSSLSAVDAPGTGTAALLDSGTSPELESHWGDDGTFVLVRPLLEGRAVGWFIFDTGASAWTISDTGAARAGLDAIGSARIGGKDLTTVYLCERLQLGPLLFSDVQLAGLNMHNALWAFGRDVVGICGGDVRRTAIVELDGPAHRLAVHDPSWNPGQDVQWHPLMIRSNLPLVCCAYGVDSEGLFLIDTGSNGSIHLFGRATESLRQRGQLGAFTSARTHMTYGGAHAVDVGSLPDFRVEDQSLGAVETTFGRAEEPMSALLADVDGIIGMRVMREHVVLIDEPGGRVAFVGRR